MPKTTKHPRLRTLVRRGANGQRWVYYYYDMRPDGLPDISLGKDHAAALVKWDELHNKKPRVKGTLEEAFTLWERDVLPTYANANTKAGYTKALGKLRPAFGKATWIAVKLPHLKAYLDKRKGKTQANRELALLSIVWNFARLKGTTELPFPAAGMERSGWKNKEQAREVEVTDAMFEAVYAEGDQLLRDAMDLASATGMRVTDVRTVPLPPTDMLRLKASKTGKKADFDLALSAVLPDLIARRRANKKAEHLMLLAGQQRRPVSYRQLHNRFVAARASAAEKARQRDEAALGVAIEGMILRDCRKYASDQVASLEDAAKLLQHSDVNTTRRHYRSRVDVIKPGR